ncbi:MAG: undecaprenyl-diphosphate phosphatase [Defluviitaleaceae bacterium]|nr:undecaprenyl-diphosphate phosphatase [Defluviitaleaceae bacterium]
MDIFQAIILGLVQGLTEFLPVSSSGHLIIFQELFGLNEPGMTFEVALHIGTLAPVFIIYWDDIWGLIKNPFQKLTLLLVAATIPAVVIVLLFGDFVRSLFESTAYLPAAFFITGVLLIYADKVSSTTSAAERRGRGRRAGRREGGRTERDMGLIDALIIGCMQGVAIAPGISRSGAVITGALSRRLNRESAARFAFLMSIPAILGGAVLEVVDIVTGSAPAESFDLVPMGIGVVVAAVSGYLAIKFMLRLIKACRLRYFSYYVFALGTFIFIDQQFFNYFF